MFIYIREARLTAVKLVKYLIPLLRILAMRSRRQNAGMTDLLIGREKRFRLFRKILVGERFGFKGLFNESNIGLPSGALNASYFFVGINPGERINKFRCPYKCFNLKDNVDDKKARNSSAGILIPLIEKYYRSNYYITNIVKIPTRQNTPPSRRLVGIFMPYLEMELDIVKPRLVIALGGWVYNILSEYGIPCRKIYHPSYIMRAGSKSMLSEYELSIERLKI